MIYSKPIINSAFDAEFDCFFITNDFSIRDKIRILSRLKHESGVIIGSFRYPALKLVRLF